MVDNVITVSIGNSRKITTRPAWLTDKGMILRFVGLDLPNYYVVDFARSLTEQALPVIGTPEGVAIPSELFHNSDKIFAWLRLTRGDNVHYTVYQITIPLQQRSEISNVQPTPEQEDIIDQAIDALNEAVASTENINYRFGGGGISSKTYESLYQFTVTTAVTAGHGEYPWADSTVTGRLDKRYKYEVAVNGVSYELPIQLFDYTEKTSALGGFNIKVIEYLGNASLFRLTDDYLLNEPFNDLPFLIVSDDKNSGKIEMYTKTAGSYTVVIKRIVATFEQFPNSLIYGSEHVPFKTNNSSSAYDVFSVGANRIDTNTARAAFALGNGNILTNFGAFAAGSSNSVSGSDASAIGKLNTSSGDAASAIGWGCTASAPAASARGFLCAATGYYTDAVGQLAVATGNLSHAEGDSTLASARCSHVEGGGTKTDTSQKYVHVGGVNNAVSTETGKTVVITRYDKDGNNQGTTTQTLGKYAEVIGNGDSDASRSNARTLDWDGNEELAGSITLGKGTADETTITAAQLKALLAML